MWIARTFRTAGDALASLLFPRHCAGCHRSLPGAEYLCAACLKKARRIERPFCSCCSQPFFGAIDGGFTCANCEHRDFHFDSAIARFRSRGVVRDLIHRLKYQGELHLRHPLAGWLAQGLADPRITAAPFDAIVPVPLHSTRRREREFNQAEVLARLLSAKAGAPMLDCLRRIRNTVTQTRLDRHERMENLRNAFQMRKTARVNGKHLLLVDDVFTTGSTADECARVLKKSGAATVRVMTVARG
jgi:competence protein ComFC